MRLCLFFIRERCYYKRGDSPVDDQNHDTFKDLISASLVLSKAPGFDGKRLLALQEFFPDANAIIAADQRLLQKAGLAEATIRAIKSPDWRLIERDLAWLQSPQHQIVVIGDQHYPKRLAEIVDPPVSLFVDGDVTILSLPQLAIVGSRSPTMGGTDNAFAFAASWARYGLLVTSGLAIGIDSAAHRGALHAKGATIAVLGNGIGSIYPRSNQSLAQQIVAGGGAIVTQYGVGTPPIGRNFPYRNRLISGLSHGVIVIEAAQRSGSLVTARYAAEQGREVFALPGSIHNPKARGCHALIRDGATLVENIDDVLAELCPQLRQASIDDDAPQVLNEAIPPSQPLTADEQRLLDILGYDQASLEVLAQRSGLSATSVAVALTNLELESLVQKDAAGQYMRKITRQARDNGNQAGPQKEQASFDF